MTRRVGCLLLGILLGPATATPIAAQEHRYLALRDGLGNARLRFAQGESARVAFLGGSITHNPGWRDLVGEELERRFPDTDFEFVNAGIPSMGSTPGAFRLGRDVLGHGRIDLLFVEAAVNDSTNGRSPIERVRGMEGIVRHVRRHDSTTDVVLLHFVDPAKMAHYRQGEQPPEIADHERVAARYGVASLELAREVTERIDAGEFTWEDDFRDLHPSPFGQRLYFQSICRLFDAAFAGLPSADAKPRPLPDPPLDRFCYDRGRLVEPRMAELGEGFRLEERWRPESGGTRAGFVDVLMVVARTPGAKLRLGFSGRAVGIFVAAGPDAGVVEARVDGGVARRIDLFTRWSARLHLPWAHVLFAELAPGEHQLELTVLAERNEQSRGHACRIAWFLVNE